MVKLVSDPARDQQELDDFRAGIPCAVVLEDAGYALDRGQSTRQCLKYRSGHGQVVIVNHHGRGWWDPQADLSAKGDVISLVQYLNPGLSFGLVRRFLRPMIGRLPTEAPFLQEEASPGPPVQDRWERLSRLNRASVAWRYLAQERALPNGVLEAAIAQDAIRVGAYGTPCFAHRDGTGAVTGFERRGPDHRSFSKGGAKTLFRVRSPDLGSIHRIIIAEASIDALSCMALDGHAQGTLYIATTGGMGPSTVTALDTLFEDAAALAGARLLIATDADDAGQRYAGFLHVQAARHGLRSDRLAPPGAAKDWNDVLKGKCHAVV